MSGNPTPWIVLAGVVAVVLYLKGYLKVPAALKAPTADQPSQFNFQSPGPRPEFLQDDLSKYNSHVLSVAFASAVRREAEQEVAYTTARKAADDLRAQFTAPFLPPPA